MGNLGGGEDFIKIFHFQQDNSKEGRVLSTARIGDIYMSRLVLDPGVTSGNYYHKKTRLMFYVGNNPVLATFIQVNTGERRQVLFNPGEKAVHVPEYVALSTKNIGEEEAVIVFFSNNPIRSEDDVFPYDME